MRTRIENGKRVPLTAEENEARDAEEAVWAAEKAEQDATDAVKNTHSNWRGSLRDLWTDAPLYIRGPFYLTHKAIDELLEDNRAAIAKQMVEHLDAPSDYNTTQNTRFEQFKSDYLAAIDTAPPHPG